MILGNVVLNSLACVAGLVWLIRLLAMHRIFRNRLILAPDSPSELPGQPPRISVLVAAKDEEENIETCVNTLMAQAYPDFEVVAIDDRSTDRTPALLTRLKGEYGDRLKHVRIDKVEDGWCGKQHALHAGFKQATGDWLLFTDADCRFECPNTLAIALADADAHKVEFLSITPVCDTQTWWERIIQPACSTTLIVWFLPERVNKKDSSTAYANGAFILTSRQCYEQAGGHEAVRHRINEDIYLARSAKQNGYGLRVVENRGLYHTRMYDSMREAWRGWTRIFYGSLTSPIKILAAITLVSFFSVFPWVGLAGAAIARSMSEPAAAADWTWTCRLLATTGLLQLSVMALVFKIMRVGPAWALTYPLGSSVVLAMLVNALLKSVGISSTKWRGQTYIGGRLQPEPGDGTSNARDSVVVRGTVEESTL